MTGAQSVPSTASYRNKLELTRAIGYAYSNEYGALKLKGNRTKSGKNTRAITEKKNHRWLKKIYKSLPTKNAEKIRKNESSTFASAIFGGFFSDGKTFRIRNALGHFEAEVRF